MKKLVSIVLVCSIIASFLIFPSTGEKALAADSVSSNIGSPMLEASPVSDFVVTNGVLTKYTGTDAVVKIPDDMGITTIGQAFVGCNNIIEITVPLGITSLGESAFIALQNLEKVTLPNTLISIGNQAFRVTPKLKTISLPNGLISIGRAAFNASGLETITLPDSVTSIGDAAFLGCDKLRIVTLSNNVTNIDSHTFTSCTSLTEIILPKNLSSIGAYAFYYCINLTNISIPASLMTIGSGAFTDCKSLFSITLPDSVNIEGDAFNNCYSLLLYGNEGSSAQNYATSHNMKFSLIKPSGLTSIATSTRGGNDGQIIETTTEMEYRLSSDTTYLAVNGSTITGLAADTYYIRYAVRPGYDASADTVIIVPDGPGPSGLIGIAPATYGDHDGQITGTTTDMEYRQSLDTVYAAVSDTSISGLEAGQYEIRYSAKAGHKASAHSVVIVPEGIKQQSAPIGLNVIRPTSAANINGQIIGVTTAMEYRISTASEYSPITGTFVTGLMPGIYYVRYRATNDSNASPDTKITLPPYMTPNATREMMGVLLDTAHMYMNSSHAYMYKSALSVAVSAAEDVQNNANATQDEINIAVFYLIKETDRAYLEDLITIASAEKQSDYTSERWGVLQTEIASSDSLLRNPAALITDISYADDKMYFMLETLPLHDSLIEIAQSYSEEFCSDKTWDMLQTVLSEALVLQTDPFWKFDEIGASIGDLLYAIFSWELDYSIEYGGRLINFGNTFFSKSTWDELNEAYKEALDVQKASNPSFNDIGAAYERLMMVDYLAFMEDMVQLSNSMQQSNVAVEDWTVFQKSLDNAKDLIDLSDASHTQLEQGTNDLFTAYKTILEKAPLGLSGVAPTSATSSDGTITGTSSIMEYRLNTGNDSTPWTAILGASVTGLAPGSYQVRYAANHITNECATVIVDVPAYTPPGGGGGTPGGGTPGGGTPGGGTPGGSTPDGGGTPSGGGGGGGGGGGVLGATSKIFWDVSGDDWFFNAVQYVVNAGMFSGTSDTRFSPGAPMTRAMLVSVLYRLDGQPAVSSANPFTDVAPGMWYTKAIIWAAKNGIATGYTKQTFKPGVNLTREQLADILYNYAKYKAYDITLGSSFNLQKYSDASRITTYAKNAMKWACGTGIISGKTPTTLAPKDTASRAEVALILQRFMEIIVK